MARRRTAVTPALTRRTRTRRMTDDGYLQLLTDQELADFLVNPPTQADKEAAQSEKGRRWAKAYCQNIIDTLGREAAIKQFERDLFGEDSRPLCER